MATYQQGQPRIYASNHFSYAINAKELHQCLFPLEHTQSTFTKWIINQIARYGFEEGYDFLPEYQEGASLKDVCLSLDMAKELARITRTEQGREARYYLIEFERQRKEQIFPHKMFDKKVRQLNKLAQSMKIGKDVVILSTVDVMNMTKALRQLQYVLSFYLTPDHPINPYWINEVIEKIKRDSGKPFQDEGE